MRKRVASGLALGAGAAALALYAPPLLRAAAILLLALATAVEAVRLVSGALSGLGGSAAEDDEARAAAPVAVASSLVVLLAAPVEAPLFRLLLLVLLGAAALRQPRTAAGLAGLSAAAVAGIWIGTAGAALLGLSAGEGGGERLFFLLLVVVVGEAMAFAGGKLVGGPRLAPVLSPGKTWAGLAAQLLFGAAAGALAAPLLGGPGLPAGALLGVLLSGAAALGDLFASFWKRASGRKDSGSLIPGHGGLLDRLDGLLFAAPALAAAL